MPRRISLSERRGQDKQGIDGLIQATGEPVPSVKQLVKATYYVRSEQIVVIEAIQLAERQRTGQRKDKSELIQEAIDLLASKYDVHIAG